MTPADDEMDVPPPRHVAPPIDPRLGWWGKWWKSLTAGTIALVAAASVALFSPPYTAIVVNMIPSQLALDWVPNPEPSIAVNPANPNEIVAGGIAEGMQAAGCGQTKFGLTFSQDRGETWTLHCTLDLGAEYLAGDPSFAYTSDGSSLLVAAQAAYRTGGKMLLRIFSVHADGLTTTWPITDLIPPIDVSLDSSHVPWIAASTNPSTPLVAIGGDSYHSVGTACHSGVVWWNYPTPTNYAPVCVSPRPAEYTPVVRTAVHGDGTAYAATYRVIQYTSRPDGSHDGATMDVVVFRHDPTEPSGGPTDPFSGLKETVTSGGAPCNNKDGLRGVRVVRCVWVPFEDIQNWPAPGFGLERRLFSHVAIAVDPLKSTHVFVAWGDAVTNADGMTLHVRDSNDAGETWSSTDLVTVSRALNPALAVSTSGHLGFSYQQLVPYADGNHWDTNMRVFDGSDVAAGPIMTFPLSTMRAGNPPQCLVMPYIGDYMDLKAINADFYGVFASTSDVSASNFPSGVTYVRSTSPPPVICEGQLSSATNMDPYFFRIDRRWFSARSSRFARSIVEELKRPFSSIFK